VLLSYLSSFTSGDCQTTWQCRIKNTCRHCHFMINHMSTRRPYNLYCVGEDIKPCSINHLYVLANNHATYKRTPLHDIARKPRDAACFCLHPITLQLLPTFHVKLLFLYCITAMHKSRCECETINYYQHDAACFLPYPYSIFHSIIWGVPFGVDL